MPTDELAETMIDSGLKAIVTAVNPSMLSGEFAGRWFDREFLADLPEGVDPLGENGEFHTCVVDGPMFPRAISARSGRVVTREIEGASDGNEDDDPIHRGSVSPVYVYADVELLG